MTTHPTNPSATLKRDRFGNEVDPAVSYARGSILRSNADEIVRQQNTYAIARARRAAHGDDAIYNLTGLIRGFRFQDGDHAKMHSYVHFGASDEGTLAPLALSFMGGAPPAHDAFLCNRVSAAALATMLALVKPGQLVYSVVPADRCHPSVKNSILAAGGRFAETIGSEAFLQAMTAPAEKPVMVVITTISPSKHHLPEAEVRRVMKLSKELGALVVLDDAHMAARLAVYGETPSLAMGADVAFWSLDKHVTGPRSGIVAGRTDLIREIRAKAFMFGLEAQLGSIVAGVNAINAFDPEPIRRAAKFTDTVMDELQAVVKGRAYRAGPGIALHGEDLLELALAESGQSSSLLVPIEATAAAGMTLLNETGAITIPVSGMPGSACVYRIMSYPDGERLGLRRIVDGTRAAISNVARLLNDRQAAAELILGKQPAAQR
jgi:L-seryl-tRNA(Ser) seleniumtransferase